MSHLKYSNVPAAKIRSFFEEKQCFLVEKKNLENEKHCFNL